MTLDKLRETITPDRYRPGKLLKAVRNPSMFKNEWYRLGLRFNRSFHRHWPHSGLDVMDADWDTLIILDGCRYDVFADEYEAFVPEDVDARLRPVTSRGSGSQEFIDRNFRTGTHHDTVYVTSNPFVADADSERFHAVENLFVSEWDAEFNTVLPESVTSAAQAAHERYPDKRLIVHYMQPHYPFIGERGRSLSHRGLYQEDSVKRRQDTTSEPDTDDTPRRIWGRLRLGEIRAETVMELYRENLRVVVPHVATLLDSIDGKTVISADHGNLFGERLWPIPIRGYGHPEPLHVSPLVTVPWLELPGETRRSVTTEPPVDRSDQRDAIGSTEVEDRLKHLGYHD